jgi:hypothetical protein
MSQQLIDDIETGRVTSLKLDESLSHPQELATTHFPRLLAALKQQQKYASHNKGSSNVTGTVTPVVVGIESVELTDHFVSQLISTDSFVLLLRHIGLLPHLRKLRVYTVYTAWPVTIWSDSRVLQNAVKLTSWNVTRGIRLTDANDIAILAACLRNHPSLNEVSLLDLGVDDESDGNDGMTDDINIWTGRRMNMNVNNRSRQNETHRDVFADADFDDTDTDDSERTILAESPRRWRGTQNHENVTTAAESAPEKKMTLDPLFAALTTIRNLETVDITVAFDFARQLNRLSDQSLRELFQCHTLNDVSLWDFGLDNRHMLVLKQALQSKSNSNIDTNANATSNLSFLSLRRNPGITVQGWKTLSDMMEQNTTLVSLYYDSASSSTNATNIRAKNNANAKNNAKNTTTSNAIEQRRLLASHHERIRMFLWLNTKGRGQLLDSLTKNSNHHHHHIHHHVTASTTAQHQGLRNEWLAFLGRVSDNPDALLYLLQAHPRLFG